MNKNSMKRSIILLIAFTCILPSTVSSGWEQNLSDKIDAAALYIKVKGAVISSWIEKNGPKNLGDIKTYSTTFGKKHPIIHAMVGSKLMALGMRYLFGKNFISNHILFTDLTLFTTFFGLYCKNSDIGLNKNLFTTNNFQKTETPSPTINQSQTLSPDPNIAK